MTADPIECNGISKGSEVEFEEKSGLKLGSGLRGEIKADFSDIACDRAVKIDGEANDRSHDLVNGSGEDFDADLGVDLAEVVEMESTVKKQIETTDFNGDKVEEVEFCVENGFEAMASSSVKDQELNSNSVEENLESQITVIEAVEVEFDQIDQGEETEEGIVADDIPAEESSKVSSKIRTCLAETELEIKLSNGSNGSVESVILCPFSDSKLENKVRNDYVQIGEETFIASVDDTKLEIEIGNSVETPAMEEPSVVLGLDPEVKLEFDTCVHETELEVKFNNGAIEVSTNVVTCPVSDAKLETKVGSYYDGNHESESICPVDDEKTEIRIDCFETSESLRTSPVDDKECVERGESLRTCPIDDVEFENDATDDSSDVTSDSVTTCHVNGTELELEAGNGYVQCGPVDDRKSGAKVQNNSAESVCPYPVCDTKSEIENGESITTCPDDDMKSESEVRDGYIENGKSVAACPVDDTDLKIEVRNDYFESGEFVPNTPIDNVKQENGVKFGSVGSGKSLPTDPADGVKLESDVINGVAKSGKSLPTCSVDDEKLRTEVRNGHVERGKNTPAFPVYDMKSETEIIFGSFGSVESLLSCPAAGVRNGSIKSRTIMPTCPVDKSKLESEVVENGQSLGILHVNDVELESKDGNCSFETPECMPTSPVGDMKSETDGHDIKDSVESSKSTASCISSVVDVENEGNQFVINDDADKPTSSGDILIVDVQMTGILPSTPGDSTADTSDVQTVEEVDAVKWVPCFMIKIPRFADEKMRAQIRLAQSQVDEKTQNRDSIKLAIQKKKVICDAYWEKFEGSLSEERAARNTVRTKRHEIDSVQSLINRMKNVTSIDEIDVRIHDMEHMIQHETMPLKEEKKLIREIKQLKNAREQLLANMATHAELQEAFEQRDGIELRLQLLKQELDSLRKEVLRTQGITTAAKKKHHDECENLREMQAQFRAADDIRQEAYTQLRNLREQLYKKNKYFRMYKEDENAAMAYASARDREGLHTHCINQVERIMELWNKNNKFRNEYVENNMMSTLRRFKTLDGRSLGPDEEPTMLHKPVEEKVNNGYVASVKINHIKVAFSTSETIQAKLGIIETVDLGSESGAQVGKKNLSAKTKNYTEEEVENKNKRTKEEEELARKEEELVRKEEELARKAEELRKEEAAIKLKEQRRLEEKAKAIEAEERKRRQAEKAQAKAELRARKEAELKEKEREKRERKKDRKRVATSEATDGSIEEESPPSSENSLIDTAGENRLTEKSTTTTKRSQKPPVPSKLIKTKPLPVPQPLRNRGKRKVQPWMWVLLAALLLVVLFLVGKYNNSSFSFSF